MSELGRKDIQITLEEAQALLKVSECGILSTVDTDGQPYGVPLNYVYINEAIYFHCAWLGHNIDNNPQVSLCVVGYSEVLPVDFSTIIEVLLYSELPLKSRGKNGIIVL